MSSKGTALISYIPMRREASSTSEMVSCLVFGESYDVLENQNDWLLIQTHFDNYKGWISSGSFSKYQEMGTVNDELYIDFNSNQNCIKIPCGGFLPKDNNIQINGLDYAPIKALKNKHHLSLSIRLQKTAISFLNTPYLWGGRTFMGIDCSGFVQMVFKACGINLKRDTSQQIEEGCKIEFEDRKSNDLMFLSRFDSDKVSHVAVLMDSEKAIHAGPSVKIDRYDRAGLYVDGIHKYKLLEIRRMV
jgi:gamma-D-glutamyl-L-lysine dipeptidyl-peptidase